MNSAAEEEASYGVKRREGGERNTQKNPRSKSSREGLESPIGLY
jgi:hypothetical protein